MSEELLKEPAKDGEKMETRVVSVVKRDELGRVLPGSVLNPEGKAGGTLNFNTLFEKAIKKIAETKNIDLDEAEVELVIKAYVEARNGNFNYYRDTMDRRYGSATKNVKFDGELRLPVRVIEVIRPDEPNTKPV